MQEEDDSLGRAQHKSAEANFDGIARAYRWLEYAALGALLERTRTEFLPWLQGCRRALVLGDGDGRFLASLLAVNPGMHADAVDTSVAMLGLLRQRCRAVSETAKLRTHRQNALTYLPENEPDLVVTHFFFDCLTQVEVEELIKRITPTLTPGAVWVVSEFAVPGGMLRLPIWLYVRLLYFAFWVMTGLRVSRLPEYGEGLRRAGFVRVMCRDRLFGMLRAELWRKA